MFFFGDVNKFFFQLVQVYASWNSLQQNHNGNLTIYIYTYSLIYNTVLNGPNGAATSGPGEINIDKTFISTHAALTYWERAPRVSR